jgi:hypothetical protein
MLVFSKNLVYYLRIFNVLITMFTNLETGLNKNKFNK